MRSKTIDKIIVFTLTFLGYAALHSLREGWSLSKAQIIDIPSLKTDKSYLGIVDTCYLLSYSFGMMVLGSLIHRISLKVYVGKSFFIKRYGYDIVNYFLCIGSFVLQFLWWVQSCSSHSFYVLQWLFPIDRMARISRNYGKLVLERKNWAYFGYMGHQCERWKYYRWNYV